MIAGRVYGTHAACLLALWQDGDNVLQRLWRLTGYLNFKWELGNFVFSITTLVLGLLVMLFALFVSRYMRRFIENRMARHNKHLDPGVQFTILRLVHYFVITIGAFIALRIAVSADFTSLAVVFTALSVGIGFGLQFIAGDIASGFIILFERPVRVGDYITIPGPDGKLTEGRVRSINLRTTIVITNDNIASVVPNSKIVNQNFLNWTFRERRTRVSIPIGVASDSDVELVARTLLRAAEDVQFVIPEPKPSVQFLEFGDFDLKFRLLVWTDRPRRHPSIRSEINYRIHRLFREEGIEIPNPQRDITLRGGALRFDPHAGLLAASDAEASEEEAEARP
ncbi:MAG: potassium-dependent mechanosensitive channel [Acidobacteriota bacterium]|jgi:small-conductance mechanosensitive channel|nr:potassium-dependent mechanosensitive channel [Acidobacteriota bacterium]MDT7779984.1 potassium-dependent mechanosensitive channel [Acidobacteriota bacterium]